MFPSFLRYREWCGLPVHRSFDDLLGWMSNRVRNAIHIIRHVGNHVQNHIAIPLKNEAENLCEFGSNRCLSLNLRKNIV